MARVSSRMAAHVRIYTRLHTVAVCFSRQPPFYKIGKQIREYLPLFCRSEILYKFRLVVVTVRTIFILVKFIVRLFLDQFSLFERNVWYI